ncbi:hypothetical protein O3M35_003916 [Rhynocoris fuscipes]|uniref:Resistance to inhibitors of cholinesterase protein 3 N-terminal domain-containing protein n=1 Tax=Rhynocoris fuscipes TaxID=488301 RepID=A0AAW1CHW7_9HEMI
MASEFSTGKSVFVLAIVTGCFAILWPNVFYPMLQGSYPSKNTATTTQGACCDVLFDNDVEAIKVMTDLCESILQNNRNNDSKLHLTAYTGQMNAIIAEACRDAIWNKCHINITEILLSKTGLNRSYKQFVDELRSLNSSICLKQSFGISFVPIGLPRTIRTWNINRPKHLRQERPPHLRPEFLHPALREKGRAIPHSHIVPKVDGRQNGPVPGMRPPMGGAGHVVAGPKGSGTMGIVMPMYTVGIVVFFLYTIMKLLFKKSDTSNNYEQFSSDPDFHRTVFGDYNYSSNEDSIDDATKLDETVNFTGDVELELLKKRLEETEKAMERIVAKMKSIPYNSVQVSISKRETDILID